MADVKSRRDLAAEETLRTIVATAARLFVEHGYAATTISQIAREAGVAVQTIYNSAGSKRQLLSRVLDFAAAGNESPRPVPSFMQERVEAEADPRKVIALLVEFWRDALARTAPILEVIRQAAALDPEIAELETQRAQQRLKNYTRAGQLLADRGDLRPGLTPDDAAAIIFSLGHPESYRLLVKKSDWSIDRWSDWIADALCTALLGTASAKGSGTPSAAS